MKQFPISLKISKKRCLVVGGGTIAERKITSLLNAGANVSVIAPTLTDSLKKMTEEGDFSFIKKEYESSDIEHFFLVIAATNNKAVNDKISKDAADKDILINCIDNAENCSFFLPAVINRGDLQVTISTAGKAPYFSKKLKQNLEMLFFKKIELDLEEIYKARERIVEDAEDDEKLKNLMIEKQLEPKVRLVLEKIFLTR